MSAETLDYHHGKHHKAYVDKTNGLIEGTELAGASLVEVIKAAKQKGDKGLFNNSAQIWNHSFFWQCLAPEGSTRPSGNLRDLINDGFGGEQALLDKLATESVNHFASGWGWLVLSNGKLEVTSLHDADTPAVHGLTPLLTIDVWEHAYYIDYRNERPKFVKSVLENIINWDFVAQNLDGKGLERADQRETATA
jgi:Fe-Mn family superoxide dismutase